jgi:integrase
VRLADGSETALFDGMNPVKAKGVPRPQAKAFAKAGYLDAEQLDNLLLAIAVYARESPGKQAKGLRDYALFFTYIMTGGRSSEIRTWTWGGLRKQAGRWMYHWENKGKEGWDEVPPPAWQAVELYLRLSGRWGKLAAGDYIFTPLGDSTKNFGRAGEEWTTNRPLSGHEVGRCLKFYGARAGLDPALLHTHILRHSAYMLYTEGGVDVRFCSKLLHHSSLAVTTLYDHVMSGQRNTEWAKASAQLKSSPTVFEGDGGR